MKLFMFGWVLLGCLQTMAQDAGFGQLYQTKTLDQTTLKRIKVETVGGNISVEGVEAKTRLEVWLAPVKGKTVADMSELKRLFAEDYDFTIKVINDQLDAIVKPKIKAKPYQSEVLVSLKVYVPAAIASRIRTSGGSISYSHIREGEQHFTTSGGDLTLSEIDGSLDGITSGGNISAHQCKGKISLTTSGGSIRLAQLDGRIKVLTSGGSIEGDQLSGEFNGATQGGDVLLKNISGDLEASTSAGTMDIQVIQLGKQISLRNFGGKVSLKLPQGKGLDLDLFAEHIETGTLPQFKGKLDEHIVKGALNGGGVPVKILANNGRISLLFQ
jgi:DUF4097 and DUF4098 domain-containing protein YvlB